MMMAKVPPASSIFSDTETASLFLGRHFVVPIFHPTLPCPFGHW
jgi:hypothetical protein